MTITMKALKTFRGMEGTGYEGHVVIDGATVAHVLDDARGGCLRWHVTDADTLARYAATLGVPDAVRGRDVVPNTRLDQTINAAVDDTLWTKKARRISKTRTLFKVPGDPVDQWRTLNAPYSDATRDHIRRTYPAATIWNEVTR